MQVFYVPEHAGSEWVSVHQSKPRDFYDMDNLESEHLVNGNGLVLPLPDLNAKVTVDVINEVVPTIRTDIDGEKMSNARGRCNEDNGMTEYERQKWEQVARNQEKMDSLHLRKLSVALQPAQPNKRTKIIDDPDYEVVGEFLCDNEDLYNGTQKRNEGKITTMNDIFSRTTDMPKIKIIVNEYGQPVGENYRKFASAIGCQVRKILPVQFNDWRSVPLGKKLQVWDNL
ncbi:uncharacterized protein [Miscanthus floridulus]|uniref:uncharacterized protein isoform X2 n=1 Tax=Miscanthus floridulus TaxID=154761 RepID=UPI0034595040